MAQERKIKPVKNNQDKKSTYNEQVKKYNRAIRCGCYFEALLIAYAMMEDRLRSYLYYLGCLKSRNSYKFDNEKIKKDIKYLVDQYSEDTVRNLGISSITGKMRIVQAVQVWFLQGYHNPESTDYLEELASCIDMYGAPDETLDILAAIRDWCDYRNEIVHALLNKNLESLYEHLSERANEGMTLARMIDRQVRCIKLRNPIRKALKLNED